VQLASIKAQIDELMKQVYELEQSDQFYVCRQFLLRDAMLRQNIWRIVSRKDEG